MTAPMPPGSPAAITVLAALLEARTGQRIAQSRSWRLETALRPLLRERKLDTLDQLVARLLDGQDHRIGDMIVEALVNGETSFFREAAMFDAVAQVVADATGRRARIWSAGCATGQEPLSLAMLLAEDAERTGAAMPEIVATDVSDAALARARAGRFTQFEIQRGLPIRRMMRWFDADGSDWIAKPELTGAVAFRRHNLVADPAPAGRFDVILCRNVLFYFSLAVKADVFSRLAASLVPGGLLLLGAGETVIGQTELFRPSTRHRGFYEPVAPGRRAAA